MVMSFVKVNTKRFKPEDIRKFYEKTSLKNILRIVVKNQKELKKLYEEFKYGISLKPQIIKDVKEAFKNFKKLGREEQFLLFKEKIEPLLRQLNIKVKLTPDNALNEGKKIIEFLEEKTNGFYKKLSEKYNSITSLKSAIKDLNKNEVSLKYADWWAKLFCNEKQVIKFDGGNIECREVGCWITISLNKIKKIVGKENVSDFLESLLAADGKGPMERLNFLKSLPEKVTVSTRAMQQAMQDAGDVKLKVESFKEFKYSMDVDYWRRVQGSVEVLLKIVRGEKIKELYEEYNEVLKKIISSLEKGDYEEIQESFKKYEKINKDIKNIKKS